jgi:hypothetical protein
MVEDKPKTVVSTFLEEDMCIVVIQDPHGEVLDISTVDYERIF